MGNLLLKLAWVTRSLTVIACNFKSRISQERRITEQKVTVNQDFGKIHLNLKQKNPLNVSEISLKIN